MIRDDPDSRLTRALESLDGLAVGDVLALQQFFVPGRWKIDGRSLPELPGTGPTTRRRRAHSC
jgi:hypothetical protein